MAPESRCGDLWPGLPAHIVRAMSNPHELLDHDVVRELREMLGAGLDPVLAQFGQQATELVAQIQGLAMVGDTAAVRPLAHRLKGSAGSLGAKLLGAEAAQLERFAVAGDTDAVLAKIESMSVVVQHTVQALHDMRIPRGA